ncbi:MAG: ABC transporter ATP-binding protein [Chloroflexota bacterium]|nr:ABC transporter ATP-binding protein [Deltaproteobacteria bacterium]MDE2970634.1 ABC transporter ATP-binding protein [Chloroflexota bacterium]
MTDNGTHPAVAAQALFFQVEARALLDGVDLQADHGQMVGLIGPNGAGKSTFLRAVSGVLRVQGGSVHLDGADLRSLASKEVAANLAIVPQIMPYTHGFTAMELVLMGRYPHLGRFQIEGKEDARIARGAMRLTETEQFAERTLDTLSGGERQRVIVSRALAQQPRVLLLDEPTANLDVLHQLKVLGLVRQLVDDGLTAVAAIHDLTLAARFCDRLVLLSEGRVLGEGAPADVLTPELIGSAFGVEAVVYPDPNTGALAISLIGPADQPLHEANGRPPARNGAAPHNGPPLC